MEIDKFALRDALSRLRERYLASRADPEQEWSLALAKSACHSPEGPQGCPRASSCARGEGS